MFKIGLLSFYIFFILFVVMGVFYYSCSQFHFRKARLSDNIVRPANIEDGQKLYQSYCASCHRGDGGGLIGPNLTDSYWIHVFSGKDALKNIIEEGVPSMGMPGWKQSLKATEIESLLLFLGKIKNSHVPSGKSPQGKRVN